MQHQRAIVKKKVTEGEVLAETAGALRRGQHPRPHSKKAPHRESF